MILPLVQSQSPCHGMKEGRNVVPNKHMGVYSLSSFYVEGLLDWAVCKVHYNL